MSEGCNDFGFLELPSLLFHLVRAIHVIRLYFLFFRCFFIFHRILGSLSLRRVISLCRNNRLERRRMLNL